MMLKDLEWQDIGPSRKRAMFPRNDQWVIIWQRPTGAYRFSIMSRDAGYVVDQHPLDLVELQALLFHYLAE